jgi:hypothetical protein
MPPGLTSTSNFDISIGFDNMLTIKKQRAITVDKLSVRDIYVHFDRGQAAIHSLHLT